METLNFKSTRQDILKTNADAKAMRLFVLLAFLLLSCSGVFGQVSKAVNAEATVAIENITDKENEFKSDNADANRQIELVQWFMGARQVNPSVQPVKTQKPETAKKILINAGMTPNRILSRTLLKKAMQYENNIA